MRELPILFSAPMVRAILEGRKTVTRRVVKPQTTHFNPVGVPRRVNPDGGPSAVLSCPYGQPGDRLWVRETWAVRMFHSVPAQEGFGDWHAYYEADGHHEYRPEAGTVKIGSGALGRLRPSIHMPRWANRITLEVTGVRVERLQDITPAQILTEGVQIPSTPEGQALIDISTKHGPAHFLPNLIGASTDDLLRAHWAALWVAINGIDSWDANPWVWCVSFKRVTP